VWSGDDAWGDRYVSTSVEFAAMLAIPLLLRNREEFGKTRLGDRTLTARHQYRHSTRLSCLLASLELYQIEEFGHPTFVIALRMKKHRSLALGKMDAWGLATDSLHEDPWTTST